MFRLRVGDRTVVLVREQAAVVGEDAADVAVGKVLHRKAENRQAKVRHAAGSREYNLALGQKRSEAVSKALQALGVSSSQLEAVSLGEEKPKSTGTDDASFAENRRADLVYQ